MSQRGPPGAIRLNLGDFDMTPVPLPVKPSQAVLHIAPVTREEDQARLVNDNENNAPMHYSLPGLFWGMSTLKLAGIVAILVLLIIALVQVDSISDKVGASIASVSSAVFGIASFCGTACTPIYGPGPIYTSGCHYFVKNAVCDSDCTSPCIPVLADDVVIDMRGFSAEAALSNMTVFGINGRNNIHILNGRIFTLVPSNSLTSIAIDVNDTDRVVVSNVQISRFYRPIEFDYSNGLRVRGSAIEFANSINWNDFNNAVVNILGSNDTEITDSTFFNNDVPGSPVEDYSEFASHGIQSTSVDGYPCIGLVVERCVFINTRIRSTSFSLTAQISSVRIERNTFEITLPYYAASAIEIGDTYTVWNGTNTIDLPVVPIVGVRIAYNDFVNIRAHPAYDTILVKMATKLYVGYNTVTQNSNAFSPLGGNIVAGMIHVSCSNSANDYGEIDPFGVQGATIERNTLIGNPNPTDPGNNKAGAGIIVEGNSYDVSVLYNDVSGIAAGMPANAGATGQCQTGPYPAQQPAAIRIAAGVKKFLVLGNTVSDGSCANGAFTVPAVGIDVNGAESRASFCDTGDTVSFPAASDGVVKDNVVWGFCGKGIRDRGNGTEIVGNEAFSNGASLADNYDVGNDTIVQLKGTPLLAGSNLSN